MRQSRRSFRADRLSDLARENLGGAESASQIRREQGWLGRGPSVVVTDLAIYHFDEAGEMRLDSVHPETTLNQIRETVGWEPKVSASLATTPPPSAEEPRLIRVELDPGEIYSSGRG